MSEGDVWPDPATRTWWWSPFATALPALLALLALLGWILDKPMLAALFPGGFPMQPQTAAGMLLAAFSLLRGSCRMEWSRLAAAVAAGLLGIMALFQHAGLVDLGFRRVVFPAANATQAGIANPGLMAVTTATLFVAFGAARLLSDRTGAGPLARCLTGIGVLMSATVLTGYLIGSAFLRDVGFPTNAGTALPSALGFFGLFGTLAGQQRVGPRQDDTVRLASAVVTWTARSRALPAPLRLISAASISVAALFARLALGDVLASYQLLLFFPAVILAAFAFGRGAGITAALLAVLLANYVLIEPRFSFVMNDAGTAFVLTVFLAILLTMAFSVEALADAFDRMSIGEERARDSEVRLRAVLDAAPIGLVFADASGRIVGGNAQVEAIFGHPVLPSVNIDAYAAWVSFHADGHRVDARDYPMAQVLAGAGRNELEVLYRRGDGRDIWVRLVAAPISDATGKIAGGVVACLDIDQKRRAQAALQAANDMLESRVAERTAELHDANGRLERETAERLKAEADLHQTQKLEIIGQLTGGVAHDFNNLLTPIVGVLDMVRRRVEGDARMERLVGGAMQSAERARVLIARLLAFARRQTLSPRAISPADLVGSMLDLIDRSLGPTIAVNVDIPETLPPVLVDANQLELALLNLAVNARDAMPKGGTLTITAQGEDVIEGTVPDLKAGGYVRLTMTDTGHGMDADTLKRAVEPFFSTKGVGEGTGLGLSMVHGLAVQSGGQFRLSSEPGVGTTVALWLPVAAGPVEPTATPDQAPMPAPYSACLLLVDDEELVRLTTAEGLRELGYKVVEAASAAAALDHLLGGLVPDAVVTDHLMPGRTGAELAIMLREHMPALPVLLVTGYANLSAIDSKGLDVLRKPFRQGELAASVAKLLKGTERRRMPHEGGAGQP